MAITPTDYSAEVRAKAEKGIKTPGVTADAGGLFAAPADNGEKITMDRNREKGDGVLRTGYDRSHAGGTPAEQIMRLDRLEEIIAPSEEAKNANRELGAHYQNLAILNNAFGGESETIKGLLEGRIAPEITKKYNSEDRAQLQEADRQLSRTRADIGAIETDIMQMQMMQMFAQTRLPRIDEAIEEARRSVGELRDYQRELAGLMMEVENGYAMPGVLEGKIAEIQRAAYALAANVADAKDGAQLDFNEVQTEHHQEMAEGLAKIWEDDRRVRDYMYQTFGKDFSKQTIDSVAGIYTEYGINKDMATFARNMGKAEADRVIRDTLTMQEQVPAIGGIGKSFQALPEKSKDEATKSKKEAFNRLEEFARKIEATNPDAAARLRSAMQEHLKIEEKYAAQDHMHNLGNVLEIFQNKEMSDADKVDEVTKQIQDSNQKFLDGYAYITDNRVDSISDEKLRGHMRQNSDWRREAIRPGGIKDAYERIAEDRKAGKEPSLRDRAIVEGGIIHKTAKGYNASAAMVNMVAGANIEQLKEKNPELYQQSKDAMDAFYNESQGWQKLDRLREAIEVQKDAGVLNEQDATKALAAINENRFFREEFVKGVNDGSIKISDQKSMAEFGTALASGTDNKINYWLNASMDERKNRWQENKAFIRAEEVYNKAKAAGELAQTEALKSSVNNMNMRPDVMRQQLDMQMQGGVDPLAGDFALTRPQISQVAAQDAYSAAFAKEIMQARDKALEENDTAMQKYLEPLVSKAMASAKEAKRDAVLDATNPSSPNYDPKAAKAVQDAVAAGIDDPDAIANHVAKACPVTAEIAKKAANDAFDKNITAQAQQQATTQNMDVAPQPPVNMDAPPVQQPQADPVPQQVVQQYKSQPSINDQLRAAGINTNVLNGGPRVTMEMSTPALAVRSPSSHLRTAANDTNHTDKQAAATARAQAMMQSKIREYCAAGMSNDEAASKAAAEVKAVMAVVESGTGVNVETAVAQAAVIASTTNAEATKTAQADTDGKKTEKGEAKAKEEAKEVQQANADKKDAKVKGGEEKQEAQVAAASSTAPEKKAAGQTVA